MIRLIVFDLDGTLIDSRRDLADSANALLDTYGAVPLAHDAIVAMVGEGARTLISRVLQAAGASAPLDEAVARFITLYEQRLVQHTRPYDGIADMLDRLSTVARLAVLTNKPQRPAVDILDHFGFAPRFLRIIGGDGPYGRKPDPAGLAFLRDAAGAAAGETLMVGDSWVDIETARRAGTRACFVTYGFGAPPDGGLATQELIIDRPSDLPRVVSTLSAMPSPTSSRPSEPVSSSSSR